MSIDYIDMIKMYLSTTVTARYITRQARHRSQVYNLSTAEVAQVSDSIAHMPQSLNLGRQLEHTAINRRRFGFSPVIFFDQNHVHVTCWKAKRMNAHGLETMPRRLVPIRCIYGERKS